MPSDRFNVYVRFVNRRLNNRHTMTNRTTTYDAGVAARELLALVNRTDLVQQGLCAVLTWNGRELFCHEYDAPEGSASRLPRDAVVDVGKAIETKQQQLTLRTERP